MHLHVANTKSYFLPQATAGFYQSEHLSHLVSKPNINNSINKLPNYAPAFREKNEQTPLSNNRSIPFFSFATCSAKRFLYDFSFAEYAAKEKSSCLLSSAYSASSFWSFYLFAEYAAGNFLSSHPFATCSAKDKK